MPSRPLELLCCSLIRDMIMILLITLFPHSASTAWIDMDERLTLINVAQRILLAYTDSV
jgi:hypothetical protein